MPASSGEKQVVDRETRAALRDATRRWVTEVYHDRRRRGTLAGHESFDRAAWVEMADQGWFGLAIPEITGGSGLSVADLAAVAESIGEHNLPEPVMAVAGVAAPLLSASAAGTNEKAATLLRGVLTGSNIVTLAYAERGSEFDRSCLITRATEGNGRYVLSGAKCAVEAGAVADHFIVTAQIEDTLGLFLVPRTNSGLAITEYRTIDGRVLANLVFDDMDLPHDACIMRGIQTFPLVDVALDHGAILSVADAVGAMASLLDETVSYLRVRHQFNKPLASFQVLQHRIVNMSIALEEAKSVVEFALEALSLDDVRERGLAVATAKVVGARSAFLISREAVQLHGGVGITDEYRVSHLFRRLVASESLYGDAEHYLERFRSATSAAAAAQDVTNPRPGNQKYARSI